MGYNPFEVNQAAKKALEKLGVKTVEQKTVVFPQEELPLTYDSTQGCAQLFVPYAPFVPVDGKEYEVVWNGVAYRAVCKGAENQEYSITIRCIGNVPNAEHSTPGIPFGIMYINDPTGEGMSVYAVDSTEDMVVSVAVSEINKTIHTIDPKFIPGVCLPVVELSTVMPFASIKTITDADDIAKLEGLNGSPCIIKFTATTEDIVLPLSVPMTSIYLDGSAVYSAVLVFEGLYKIMVTNDGNGWTFAIVGE